MKLLAQTARLLVGVIFIFSGFVKVVDPIGTGIKLEEYFEVFAQDLPSLTKFFLFFAHHSLLLSLVFCALEVILGVAVLAAYRMRITAWVLLSIIVFFTFLTFYSAYFNKVTDCGCFGDFLKLKPWTSFSKDIFLTVFILIIVFYRNSYRQIKIAPLAVGLTTLFAFGVGIYAIYYLPPIDFLPYAIGKSIPEQMKPTGVKPIIEYTFLNKKTGDEKISQEYLMDTITYKYKKAVTLNEDKLKPKITDYAVSDTTGNVVTDSTFMGKKLLVIFKNLEEVDNEQVNSLQKLTESVKSSGIKSMVLMSIYKPDFEKFRQANHLSLPYYTSDATVLKTMARTNPCVILLENGVVKGKWGNHSIPDKADVLSKL